MENMHPVDSLFREKLKDKGNVFKEAHWEMLLQELESDKRRSILYYWRYAAAIAVFAIGSWYFIGNGFDNNVVVSTTPPPVQTETPTKDLAVNTPVVESDQAESKKTGENKTADIQNESSLQISSTEIVEKKKKANDVPSVKPTDNNSHEVIKKVAGNSVAANWIESKALTSSDNGFSSPSSTEYLLDNSQYQTEIALSNTSDGQEEDIVFDRKMENSIPSMEVEAQVEQTDLVASESTNTEKSDLSRESAIELDKLSPLGIEFDLDETIAVLPEKTFPTLKEKKRFLSIGPAFMAGWNTDRASSLKSIENTFQTPGLEMAYHFNDHWDLGIGVFYGKKRYTIDGANFSIDANQSASRVIEVYNDIIDIPLSLGYTFGKSESRLRPFLRAGISMSRFNGIVESSVAYNPFETALIDVTPEPEVVVVSEDDLVDFGPEGPQGGGNVNTGGAAGPSDTPSTEEDVNEPNEPIEPVYQEVLVYGAYGDSPMASGGRLVFDKKVDKMLPFYGIAAAGLKVRLSDRLSLFLSGQYRMTRKFKTDFDALSAQSDFSILNRAEEGLVSQKGFKDISGLLSLRYNLR